MFFKWKTPATKYQIHSIPNFMANILADKTVNSDFSFKKKDLQIIVSNVTVSNVTFCLSKNDTIAA